MKVLIVSFDKSLVNKLRKALEGFDVVDVKNGEEALSLASPNVDVVVYDAIAGSVSEEDINNMYRQKFKDAKFVILMDDLFPIDLKNIETPKKVGIPREEADKKVLEAITKEPEVMFALQEPETTPLIEEGFSFRELSLEETTPQMEPIFQETLEELPTEEVVFAYQEAPVVEEKKKLLVFSFDNTLIEVLKEQLLEDYEFIVVSTPKEVKERAKDADVLVFDTVSGMIAQKLLTELSKDETLAKKPYVILIDELFAIDVASIPIENKFSYARESELGQAINKVKELSREGAPALELEELAFPTQEQKVEKPEEIKAEVASILEEIMKETFQVSEPFQEEGEQITARQVEESKELALKPQPEASFYIQETISEVLKLIKERFDKLEELILSRQTQIDTKELADSLLEGIRLNLEEMVRQEVRKALEQLDMVKILREETYKAVKERLKELIT